MLDILQDLEAYSGAQHSSVGVDDRLIASTCPPKLHADLERSLKVVRQLLDGVRACGRQYQEVHLEMDRNLVLGYRFSDDCTLLLLTRKGVNMALMNTAVRSVQQRVLEALAQMGDTAATQQSALSHADASALSDLMNKLCDRLVDDLGSSGAVSFYRILNEWKRTHGMDKYRLPDLIKLLAAEQKNHADRAEFLHDAVALTRSLIQAR
jgi:predicted regulator of Ras-like GTPase activity (Roadblock/LC7/MglB family)